MLDRRGGDHAARRAFDDAVWADLGTTGTILITDLSGFTRLTQQHGILHFLQMIRRFSLIAKPLFPKHGGVFIRYEADDLVGVFDRPEHAIACALDMMRELRALNGSLDEHDRIGLSVGLEHGRYLRLEDDVFGDPVNLAYKLGEDVAARDEILIGSAALRGAEEAGFSFPADVRPPEPRRLEVSRVMIDFAMVRLHEPGGT
jgi:class 3 adenylate cyclase